MARTDDPIDLITGVRPIGEERKRETPGKRGAMPRHVKSGKDSVTISPRARRLADIEEFLGEGLDGAGAADDKS